jgi:hypothetical protein
MELPGGLVLNGQRHRDFSFRPLTGHVELVLCHGTGSSVPQQVTRALASALLHVGGQVADADLVGSLAVGDRQFLMRQLAAQLDRRPLWLTCACRQCERSFDVPISEAQLPCKPAGPGFPEVELPELGLRVRVPTGLDQALVADVEDGVAVRLLMARVATPLDPEATAPPLLSAEQALQVESVIEAMAPEVTTEIVVDCPECKASNHFSLSPYRCLRRSSDVLLDEVHTLASAYHWSEEAILGLTTDRRLAYLRRIDRSRGIHDAEAYRARVEA